MNARRRSSPRLPSDVRQQLADEAARLISEHGIQDFALAKRKAAERLGVRTQAGALPSNEEIQERLMALLEAFRPKLVGPVLEGTATETSAIELHVFSDAPEAVAAALEDRGLRLRDSQRRYRFRRESAEQIPGYDLTVDEEELEVMVFPERGSAHAPLSPIDGKPMRRASRSAVLALLEPAPV